MGIARRLGYISVVELLKRITTQETPPIAPGPAPGPSGPRLQGGAEEKYRPVVPESMQEAAMSDSEDEGGK